MNTEFVELAGRVNVGMADYAFNRITGALNAQKQAVNGARVLILGVSYKPNVSDLRESPSLRILQLLINAGAEVVYHDPHVPNLPDQGLTSVELTKAELVRADCVVISTNHDDLDLYSVVEYARKILDFRN